MEESLAKVLSFIVFIALGQALRRFGILRPETFGAISGLVMNVTLPSVIIANLNGLRVAGDLLYVAIFGFCTNLVLFVWAKLLTMREKDPMMRDFKLLNLGGYSVGPFAVPYMQAFYPTTGVLTACMFDVGNVFMSGGGTYALIAGTREKTTLAQTLKTIGAKLIHSGPLITFLFVIFMSIFSLKLPDGVVTCAKVAAGANTFLCMIMVGEAIEFEMSFSKFLMLLRILALRWIVCIALSLAAYHLLPFETEMLTALALICLSPIPAMNLIFTSKLGCDISLGANLNSLNVATSVIAMSVALVFLGAV